MNATDQIKVLNSDFIIIRERETGMKQENILICCKTKAQPEWHHFETGFRSKAARRRRMKTLLECSLVIED
ncbi:MAG: hypothetical protein KAX38_06390 [Candidatus Krumholzibacteria bacterium]|nr:hypothetical protein [Candidatus Krumholzibacteria bacterium]